MLCFFIDIFLLIKRNFFKIGAIIQNQRLFYLALFFFAFAIEIFSVLFFQKILNLNPCELCVYIRFSFILMAFGFLIAFINPKNIIVKFLSYIVIFYALFRGIIWNILLEKENILAKTQGYISDCKPIVVKFPFGLPLEKWFPTHFNNPGTCGDDGWFFLWLNMPEWLFFIYAGFLLLTVYLFISFILNINNKNIEIA